MIRDSVRIICLVDLAAEWLKATQACEALAKGMSAERLLEVREFEIRMAVDKVSH